jgi:hypothetical protein
MKGTARTLLAVSIGILLSSCAAGVVDRTEDRYDRRENVNDKVRGRRGLLY